MAGETAPDSETAAEESDYLYQHATAARAEGLVANTSLLEGPVAQAIGRRVRATADLVVMTTHGRGPFSRLWLGSVADELLRILDRAILLIRPTMEAWATAAGPPYRRILLPLDAWDGNTDAVETAIALGSTKTEYVLLHVVDVPVPAVAMSIPMAAAAMPTDALESKVAERLEGIANTLGERGLKVRTRVEFAGSAAQGILDVAESEAPDLIAMATRRPGRIERMLLGSVTDKVVRASKEPVLVVPVRG
jgi:nucleotide-binding universal stress UspA family protein